MTTTPAASNRTITIPAFLANVGAGGTEAERAPALAETRKLAALQRRVHESWEEVCVSMRDVRVLVVSNGGLPAADRRGRRRLWLAMLEVRGTGVDGYERALALCPSACAGKINNDAFRTLAGDDEFRKAVATESVVRVLNALLSAPDRSASDPPRYVQGMNTLLAPFLYVMDESAAFYAFRQFLRNECPLYARPSLPGVHACVQLVDECLAFVDPHLFSHLRRHGAVAKIYAFPAAMTLSANVGPLQQVVRLWDFLLAFGVHLNVVCIVAQLLAMRELLVTTSSPMLFLRSWPPLRAAAVIRRTRELYDLLPESLRSRIKRHAHDPKLAESLASAPQIADPAAAPAVGLTGGTAVDGSSLKRDHSPQLGNSPSNSNASSRRSSASGRPRAKTFAGTTGQKRIRTAGNYGELGLGITTPATVQQQHLASPAGARRIRGKRLVAGSEALWLLERKLSAEFDSPPAALK
ncbi:CDC16 protein [Linderina macrospora]|uniref:CDC16 protein n=1 Tax=Linderina macrospora TaxID=4868 RepID=A0ACC1JAH3_9FUNG|nr:CDC16 protein [Linderina macrospora]